MRGAGATEAFAALLLGVLSVLFVADHDAWTPDEPRVIELARSVGPLRNAVPVLCGKPFLEQPPLYYWTVGLAYELFGTTVPVARAVSSSFGILTLVVTYLFAARLAGRKAGALAALALGLTAVFFWISHRIVVDPALALFVTCSGYASYRGLTAPAGRGRSLALLAAYAAASLAYMAKGVVGIGLSGFAFVAVVAALREPRLLLRAHLWAAPLVLLAVTGPYHYAVYRETGAEGLHTLLIWNTVHRATGIAASHARPWWYYFVFLPPNLLPAFFFFAGGLLDYGARRRAMDDRERRAYEIPLVWLGLAFAALSLATAKRELYLLPLAPPAAIVAGLWLERVVEGRAEGRYARILPLILAALVGTLGLALPIAAVAREVPPLLPALGGALTLGTAAWAVHELRRGRPAHGLGLLAAGFVAQLAFAAFTFVPAVDAHRRLGPFLADAGTRVPAAHRIFLLSPDESTCGAVPFYTGREAIPLHDAEHLERRLEEDREIYVIVVDKRDDMRLFRSVERLAPEVLSAAIRPGARTLRLLRFRAPRGQ